MSNIRFLVEGLYFGYYQSSYRLIIWWKLFFDLSYLHLVPKKLIWNTVFDVDDDQWRDRRTWLDACLRLLFVFDNKLNFTKYFVELLIITYDSWVCFSPIQSFYLDIVRIITTFKDLIGLANKTNYKIQKPSQWFGSLTSLKLKRITDTHSNHILSDAK